MLFKIMALLRRFLCLILEPIKISSRSSFFVISTSVDRDLNYRRRSLCTVLVSSPKLESLINLCFKIQLAKIGSEQSNRIISNSLPYSLVNWLLQRHHSLEVFFLTKAICSRCILFPVRIHMLSCS